MNTNLNNYFRTQQTVLPLLLSITIVTLPFVEIKELMRGTQTGKSFYFALAMLALLNVGFMLKSLSKQNKRQLKPTDIFITLYFAYSLAHPFIFAYNIPPLLWVESISLGIFYVLVRQINSKYFVLLLYIVLAAITIQAIYGNLQLYSLCQSNHALFCITGSFFNPGPYAGFLCIGLPVALYLHLIYRQLHLNKLKWLSSEILRLVALKYIAPTTLVAVLLVLPATRSRAAWLGAFSGCVAVGWHFRKGIIDKIKARVNTVQKKILLLTIPVLVLSSVFGIYKYKQASADGRLLIWNVGTNMLADKPIWGHGISAFAAKYMNYQAEYFKPNPDIQESMVADNVSYAYNEFLKLSIEKGIAGLILALLLLWSLFFIPYHTNTKTTYYIAARCGLLAILCFSFFSYPSEILPIKMILVLFIALIASRQKTVSTEFMPHSLVTYGKHRAFTILFSSSAMLLICLTLTYPSVNYLQKQYNAYKHWKDASDIYNVGAYPESLDDFKLAYPQLKTNGAFLIQYGKAFEMAEKPDSAIQILNQAKQHLNNTILYTSIGNCYKKLAMHTKAEQAYKQAWLMAPSRFYPLYLLAKLYDETGQNLKAVAMANTILEKKVKIPSTAIDEIKEEVQKILDKQASLQNSNQLKGKGQEANLRKQSASCPAPFLKKKVRCGDKDKKIEIERNYGFLPVKG